MTLDVVSFLKHYGPVIADDYESMMHEPNREPVRASYQAFIGETLQQFDSMRQSITVHPWTQPGQPYKDSRELHADVCNNRRLFVFLDADLIAGHPMSELTSLTWGREDDRLTVNHVFRAVHDYYGHVLPATGFGAVGEERAYRAHAKLYSNRALLALACETRAQSCTFNYGRHARTDRTVRPFPEQKSGLLSSLTVYGGLYDR